MSQPRKLAVELVVREDGVDAAETRIRQLDDDGEREALLGYLTTLREGSQ